MYEYTCINICVSEKRAGDCSHDLFHPRETWIHVRHDSFPLHKKWTWRIQTRHDSFEPTGSKRAGDCRDEIYGLWLRVCVRAGMFSQIPHTLSKEPKCPCKGALCWAICSLKKTLFLYIFVWVSASVSESMAFDCVCASGQICSLKRALYSLKRAQFVPDRALCSLKRVKCSLIRAPSSLKRALFSLKKAQFSPKTALCSHLKKHIRTQSCECECVKIHGLWLRVCIEADMLFQKSPIFSE